MTRNGTLDYLLPNSIPSKKEKYCYSDEYTRILQPQWPSKLSKACITFNEVDKIGNCVCDVECDANCLNRTVFLECSSVNCNLSSCLNRASQTKGFGTVKYFNNFGKIVDFGSPKGRGIVAKRNILEGEVLMEYLGKILTIDQYDKGQKLHPDMFYGLVLPKASHLIIDAYSHGNESRFINHSCCSPPNLELGLWMVPGIGKRLLFSSCRSIKKNEELVFDYFQFKPNSNVKKSIFCSLCAPVELPKDENIDFTSKAPKLEKSTNKTKKKENDEDDKENNFVIPSSIMAVANRRKRIALSSISVQEFHNNNNNINSDNHTETETETATAVKRRQFLRQNKTEFLIKEINVKSQKSQTSFYEAYSKKQSEAEGAHHVRVPQNEEAQFRQALIAQLPTFRISNLAALRNYFLRLIENQDLFCNSKQPVVDNDTIAFLSVCVENVDEGFLLESAAIANGNVFPEKLERGSSKRLTKLSNDEKKKSNEHICTQQIPKFLKPLTKTSDAEDTNEIVEFSFKRRKISEEVRIKKNLLRKLNSDL